jgi:hypothetical protein
MGFGHRDIGAVTRSLLAPFNAAWQQETTLILDPVVEDTLARPALLRPGLFAVDAWRRMSVAS